MGINPLMIVWYIFNLAIIIVLLWLVLYKPLIKMMDGRKETIRENLNAAEIAKREAAEEMKRYAADAEAQRAQDRERFDEIIKRGKRQVEEALARVDVEVESRTKKEVDRIQQERTQLEEQRTNLLKDTLLQLEPILRERDEEVIREHVRRQKTR